MKFVANLKLYDTDLSEEICSGSIQLPTELGLPNVTIYPTREGTLYRSRKGTYFFVFKKDYDNYYMRIFDESEAKSFVSVNDYQKYVELFGEMEEG